MLTVQDDDNYHVLAVSLTVANVEDDDNDKNDSKKKDWRSEGDKIRRNLCIHVICPQNSYH